MKISVISPVYRAENFLDLLVQRITEEVSKITEDFEIVLVNDGSPDNSWDKIVENCKKDKRVKGVKLSRNFGQHYAVTAGMQHAKGDVCVIMDCDLQDNPKYIAELLGEINKGHHIVFTRRKNREHGVFKKITAKLYHFVFTMFADTTFNIDVGTMIMFTARAREEFLKINDQDRLYIQIFKWIGFSHTYYEVVHDNRVSGKSNYSFMKLMAIAIQGWTFHSDKLLRASVYSGFIMSFLAVIGIIWVLINYFLHGFQSGWPSLFVLILFSTGIIQLSIGILGIYLGKSFKQIKNRPLYIVEEILNDNG